MSTAATEISCDDHPGGGIDDSMPRNTSSTAKSLPDGCVLALTSFRVTDVALPEFHVVLKPSHTPSSDEVRVPRSWSFA